MELRPLPLSLRIEGIVGPTPPRYRASLRSQRLPQSEDAVAVFPLTTGFQERNAIESFHDIALGTGRTRGAETAMLRHNKKG